MSSREFLSGIIEVLMFLIAMMRLEVNFSSFLLFLMIVYCLSWINSSIKTILTVSGVWSDRYWISKLMLSLSIFMELEWRKNRLITELVLLALSEY